jgi:hypothetical protein
MGKDPDTIYREISDHRRRMTSEIEHLEERARDDLGQMKDRALSHTPTPPSALTDRASEHPMASVALAFGVGVVAGILSDTAGSLFDESGNDSGRKRDADREYREYRAFIDSRQRENGSSGGGLLAGGAGGMITQKILGMARDTVRPLIDDVVAGFKGDERTPAERDYARETAEAGSTKDHARAAA